MTIKNTISFLLIVLLFPAVLLGQRRVSDTAVSSVLFHATYAYQIAGADLTETFGNNSTIGGGVSYKSTSNWLIGGYGHFIFGDQVNNRSQLLSLITTNQGEVIDGNGTYTSLALFERGYHFQLKGGKIFPLLGLNQNSGFFIQGAIGYLSHRIRIETQFGTAPQLMGDYVKGYDRMRGGFAYGGEIGYLLMSNARILNFSIALEYTIAKTKSLRDYDFDLMRKDDRKYTDQYMGIRISWMIPTYRRAPEKYYYY